MYWAFDQQNFLTGIKDWPIQQKQRPENQNNDAKTMKFTELETRFSDNQTHHYLHHHHHHYTTSSLNFYTVINVGDKNTKKNNI